MPIHNSIRPLYLIIKILSFFRVKKCLILIVSIFFSVGHFSRETTNLISSEPLKSLG